MRRPALRSCTLSFHMVRADGAARLRRQKPYEIAAVIGAAAEARSHAKGPPHPKGAEGLKRTYRFRDVA